MQHPLADRLQPVVGHLSRNCPGNVAWKADRPAELSVAFSREEDQEDGVLHHAILQQQEQEAAPPGPEADEGVDRASRGSTGKGGEVRRLGRAFDLSGTDGRWRVAGGLFAGDASGGRGRAAS